MHRLRLAAPLLLVAAIVTGSWLLGQEPTKYKGTLPQNWKKLGLTDEQVQKIYKIQHDFKEKTDPLKKKIEDFRKEEKSDMDAVLTAAQKDLLKQILTGEKDKDKDTKDKDKDKLYFPRLH